jgi:hypothetical protein
MIAGSDRTKPLDKVLVLLYYQGVKPTTAYRKLNKLLWMGRLPMATIHFADPATIPDCYGITLYDRDFACPVIFLNSGDKKWGKTLIHEALHVAEPELPHGEIFDALVRLYYLRAIKNIRGFRGL